MAFNGTVIQVARQPATISSASSLRSSFFNTRLSCGVIVLPFHGGLLGGLRGFPTKAQSKARSNSTGRHLEPKSREFTGRKNTASGMLVELTKQFLTETSQFLQRSYFELNQDRSVLTAIPKAWAVWVRLPPQRDNARSA